MKPWAKSFYNSKAWYTCRNAYIEKVGGLCEQCLAEGRFTPAEIVHHITEITPENITDPSVTLNFANLRALCRECHASVHGLRPRRYNVDAVGRVTVKD